MYKEFEFEDSYQQIVKNHLKLSGKDILEKLSYYCDKYNGRISYENMKEILGEHYPRPRVNKSDEKICIILFLKIIGMYFNHDEDFVYFP